jgi:nucleotide-binding universal stress UspA family protein
VATGREPLRRGAIIDGFTIGDFAHRGAMGDIFRVTGPDTGFAMAMKVPHLAPGDSDEGLLNFEVESMILPALSGPHAPRFVAAGDLTRTPYLVFEWIAGESLRKRLEGRRRLPADETARVGAAVADALHGLHLQDTIHLDLKPDNILLRADGSAALVDFGLAHHARFPDLLAEERRLGAGSAPYISPEQVFGERSDPRSDLYALGATLYEACTGRLPFGAPQSQAGLRDRVWADPVPPSVHEPSVPPWLQEVILRCLEPQPADRYQSAAHVAHDLRHPDSIALTERATRRERPGLGLRLRRWWQARSARVRPTALPGAQVRAARVVLVAIDTANLEDERHAAVRQTVARILSIPAEYRLICVSVIAGGPGGEGASGTSPYLDHLVRLRQWVDPLGLPPSRLSMHVLEAADAAATLVEFAGRNNVDLIVVGAPAPAQTRLAWWRSVASGVAASAACSVHLVRLAADAAAAPPATSTASAAPGSPGSPA